MSTPVSVRPYAEVDREACEAIESSALDEDFIERFIAEDATSVVVGWGQIARNPWQFHPRKFELRWFVAAGADAAVDGVLVDRLIDHLIELDALMVRTSVPDDDIGRIVLLEGRGFSEAWRLLESSLDVTAFDPTPFAADVEGITVTTLHDELARDPSALQRVYDLYVAATEAQVEADPITPPAFDAFVKSDVESSTALLDAWFLAADGDRFIGLSTLEAPPDGDSETVESGYTAVLPAYRHRGIAIALKLRTIAWARTLGYRTIHTSSSSTNGSMLRINEALGFIPGPARITFERRLGASATAPTSSNASSGGSGT